MAKSKAKYWIVAISEQRDFIKWGKDGDVKFPHDNKKELDAELAYLQSSPLQKNDVFYVLKVYPNGQMVTMEVDGGPVNPNNFEHWLELIHLGYFLSDGQFINTAVIHWGEKNRKAIEAVVAKNKDIKRLKAQVRRKYWRNR